MNGLHWKKKEGIAADLSIAVSANRGKISELAKQIKIPALKNLK